MYNVHDAPLHEKMKERRCAMLNGIYYCHIQNIVRFVFLYSRTKQYYSKGTKAYSKQKMKVAKDYKYVPDLMTEIFKLRQESDVHLDVKAIVLPEDPRRIRPNIAATAAVAKLQQEQDRPRIIAEEPIPSTSQN